MSGKVDVGPGGRPPGERAGGLRAHAEPAHLQPAHAEPAHVQPAHAQPAHVHPAQAQPPHVQPPHVRRGVEPGTATGRSGPGAGQGGEPPARVVGARATQQVIASLASRQHGVVSRAQLRQAGLGAAVVDRLVRIGQLTFLHRGVYLAGPVLPPYARQMAAALACGDSAAVSHDSAAGLWLPRGRPSGGEIGVGAGREREDEAGHRVEVSVPASRRLRRPGIRIHRVSTLRAEDVTTFEGIPITTTARTLCDIAGRVPARGLERALAEALARGLTDEATLHRLLRRPRLPRAAGRLRALLESDTPPARTRSAAEEAFLRIVRKPGLDPPEVNVRLAGFEVDFLWRAARLVVEIDGFAFHSSRRKFESDRRRDAVLAAAGYVVVRVTWRQIQREPDLVLIRVAQALARAAAAVADA